MSICSCDCTNCVAGHHTQCYYVLYIDTSQQIVAMPPMQMQTPKVEPIEYPESVWTFLHRMVTNSE